MCMGGCAGKASKSKSNSYTPKKASAGAKSRSMKPGNAGSYGNSGAFGAPKVRFSGRGR